MIDVRIPCTRKYSRSLSQYTVYLNLGLDCSQRNTINEDFINFSQNTECYLFGQLGYACMSCNRANNPIKNMRNTSEKLAFLWLNYNLRIKKVLGHFRSKVSKLYGRTN